LNEDFKSFQFNLDESFRADGAKSIIDSFFTSSYYNDKKVDQIFKTNFSRTAINQYRKNFHRDNDPSNLIHYRENRNGILLFAMNKGFYRLKSPDFDKKKWHGSLLCNRDKDNYYLFSENAESKYPVDENVFQKNLIVNSPGNTNGVYLESVKNVKISQVPSSWFVDGKPRLIIDSDIGGDDRTLFRYKIMNKSEIISDKVGNGLAMSLLPGDKIVFKNFNDTHNLAYNNDGGTYLSKNYWLNGSSQEYYPLGDKFIWAFHMNTFLKSEIKDSSFFKQDFDLTLDPRLHESFYKIAKEHYKPFLRPDTITDRELKLGMALTVLNGEGHIWALFDYQNGRVEKDLTIDPNRKKDLLKKINDFYLISNPGDERLALGNKSIMRMDNGPGSTIKPIFYSAVNSMYNMGWQSLRFQPPNEEMKRAIMEPGDSYRYNYFGNERVKWMMDPYNLNSTNVDNVSFIYKSKNSYLSMILYLGSLTKPEMEEQHREFINPGLANQNSFLHPGYAQELTGNLPLFSFNGRIFHIHKFPDDFSKSNSLLAEGLYLNFNLPVKSEHQVTSTYNIMPSFNDTLLQNSNLPSKQWSFPEPSRLYMIDREINRIQNGLVQLVSGANPLNVTPLKMAEMTAGLFSANSSFTASVDYDHVMLAEDWAVDDTWNDINNYISFNSMNTFNGMHQAIYGRGTSSFLRSYCNRYPELYFYAKTGTLNDENLKNYNDKMLTLVISKNRLHNLQNIDKQYLRDNKIVVMYFAFYKQAIRNTTGSVPAETIGKFINSLIGSDTFKNYFDEH
jgi:signal peptidase I